MDWNQLVADAVFYVFAALTVGSALMVITMRNAVHSVLFLVLTFFSAAGLFVLLGAEFLAAILVIVYMGAVAILFLFVVMMLDVDFAALRQGMVQYLPLALGVGLVIAVEMTALAVTTHINEGSMEAIAGQPHNTLAIGQILYTQYLFPFELASLVLLVALVGAIVLTHSKRTDVKTQNILKQVMRRRDESVELKKVASGEGAQPQ
jgi:NADH-quinone oxidoreductase subunit J